MANISQSELNSIREVVACHLTTASKLSTYASACQDAQVKQMFQTAAGQAQKSAQTLLQML